MLFWPLSPALAQEPTPAAPVYVVESGDSLWVIAQRFGVSVDELAKINGITDPNQLVLGMELKIPGLQGVSGKLLTQQVAFGETLRSLSRRYNISQDILARLNRVVNPGALYAGRNLILTTDMASVAEPTRVTLFTGESLLELAVANGANPWSVVNKNQLAGTWQCIPGDVLQIIGKAEQTLVSLGPSALPGVITGLEVKPLPLVQGKATVIRLAAQNITILAGTLADYKLNFFQNGGEYIAIQGVHAMFTPGFYNLTLSWQLSDNTPFSFSQMIYVKDGGYPYEIVPVADQSLTDPTITQPEEDQLKALMANMTPTKLWDGQFSSPVDAAYTECWPSTFGRRRSYNGSAFTYMHAGLDFCGQVGHSIYAPGAGKVVFVGTFPVRGNTTVIDHGWGIFTVYGHQSEIKVKVDDIVTPGQIIGLVGSTGRVTGPHLHWEVWAGDIQVDPWDWLQNTYP
jgi:murein DD-endopeptidase MepM/ murein hydrolase activator NlpD